MWRRCCYMATLHLRHVKGKTGEEEREDDEDDEGARCHRRGSRVLTYDMHTTLCTTDLTLINSEPKTERCLNLSHYRFFVD